MRITEMRLGHTSTISSAITHTHKYTKLNDNLIVITAHSH